MTCDQEYINAQKRREREEAKKKLDADIAAGVVQVVRNGLGQVGIVNWSSQPAAVAGWCEGCVLSSLSNEGTWMTKSKLAAAGVAAGQEFVAASHSGHTHGGKGGHH